MRDGSIIEVNYTGKIVLSNEVFDTTIEKKAIEAGIFNQNAKYGPFPIIVGEKELLPGLDNAIKEMKEGEEKKILLNPSEAYGERNPKLVRVLPMKEFQRQKMNPAPGLIIEADGIQGRVQSVSGGRVRVDFNHALAGKELEYELKVEKEIKGAKEQTEALFEKFFGAIPEKEKKLKIKENEVEIALDSEYASAIGPLKKRFSELVTKHIKGIEKVKFIEEFGQKEGRGNGK